MSFFMSWRAISRPIPRLPPVTMAIFLAAMALPELRHRRMSPVS
jgi:hypothetical protein